MSEQPYTDSSPEELQNTQEQLLNEKRFAIERISSQLGFVESPHMRELRAQIVEGLGIISIEALNVWRDHAEGFNKETNEKDSFSRAQLGLLLTKALVYLDANMPNEFYEDIDEATQYASNLGLEDVVEELMKL
jgi:hypothetical protein